MSQFIKYLPIPTPSFVRRFVGDERGAVGLTYAILVLTMLIALGTGIDMSNALQVKYRFDLAADAAAIACGETWEEEMATGAGTVVNTTEFTALQTKANTFAASQGAAFFNAQASSLGVDLQSGYPNIQTVDGEASAGGVGGASVTCQVTYKATNANYLMQLAGFKSLSISGGANSNVVMTPYVAVYLILDTSASMMVGSTPSDQAKVAKWVSDYDTKPAAAAGTVSVPSTCMVFASCANLPLAPDWMNNYAYPGKGQGVFAGVQAAPNNDITPCAFACHEENGSTVFYVNDMQQGELVAAAVGATTRFDVMKQALVNDPVNQDANYCNSTGYPVTACANTCPPTTPPADPPACLQYEGLLPFIRDHFQATYARATLNTFSYNLYGFNWGIGGGANEPPTAEFNPNGPGAIVYTDNSQYHVVNQTSLTSVAAAVNKLTIGLDTHLNPPVNSSYTAVLPALASIVGTTNSACLPVGSCANNPLKFVIIVTDGLNSDRNWNCGPTNCAYPPDPIPSSITQEPSIAPATYCAMWNVTVPGNIPLFDGVPMWQGTGVTGAHGPADAGNIGQCHNNNYNPGFFLGASPPAVTSPAGSSPSYSGVSPYDITKVNGTASTDNLSYDLTGQNAVWYAGPIQTSYCQTMRKNGGLLDHVVNGTNPGVTIAVLETPYVPMTGQDPIYYPYEGSVQAVIWPLGNPATHIYPTYTPTGSATSVPMSALSQALQSCATPGGLFYFQAASDSAIATGFKTLFDNFIGQIVHISK